MLYRIHRAVFDFCAGRTGRETKPPPQLGQTFPRTLSTQVLQNVHSKEQIIASDESGGSGLLQYSHVGLSSNTTSPYYA